jgi:ATP phosphoribosyltransferase
MDANGLRPVGTLLESEAVLVGGRAAIESRRDLVERLELMLSGVVAARRRRYVMMNAHVDDLPRIREVLPGMGAPSVLQLADEGEIAVHAAVDAGDVWELLPVLREAGATSILVLPIERLVA